MDKMRFWWDLSILRILKMGIWNLNKAVAEFRQRGVQIKMITGDARETALAISNQLGLLAKKALSGKEIDELGELELPTAVSESSGKVFNFSQKVPSKF